MNKIILWKNLLDDIMFNKYRYTIFATSTFFNYKQDSKILDCIQLKEHSDDQ